MELSLIINIITIILTGAVAGFVYSRNPRSNVTRSFLVLIFLFELWTLTHIISYASLQVNLIFVEQLSYIFGVCIAWAFFGFSYFFPSPSLQVKKNILITGLALSVVLIGFILSPTGIITGIYPSQPGGTLLLKTIFFSFYAFVFSYIFTCAYYLLNKKSKNLGGESKILIRYIIICSSVPLVITAALNIIFLNFLDNLYLIYSPMLILFFTFGVAYILIRSERP